MWRQAVAAWRGNEAAAVFFFFAVVAVVLLLWVSVWYSRRLRFSLDGRVVVVTGGASGIGKQLAQTIVCSARSVTVVLLDIDDHTLTGTQRELTQLAIHARTDSTVRCFKCDVADERAVRECVQKISQAVAPKSISVLINNAGIVNGQSVDALTSSQIRRIFEVNTLGHIWVVQSILPLLKKQANDGAMIVTVSSVMGLITGANLADYCATKAAVAAFHDCMRLELWRDGFSDKIQTLLVCPNAIDTGMFEGIMAGSDWTAWLSRLLLPASSTQAAATRIYEAMTRQEQFVVSCYTGWRGVIVPWLPAMARLLPVSWFDRVVFLGGGVHGMDTFVGKPKKTV